MAQFAAEQLVFFDGSVLEEKKGWRHVGCASLGDDAWYDTDVQHGNTRNLLTAMIMKGYMPDTDVKEEVEVDLRRDLEQRQWESSAVPQRPYSLGKFLIPFCNIRAISRKWETNTMGN